MGHLFSLMSPIGILKKKSDFKLLKFLKNKRFLSFGFKLEKLWFFPFWTIARGNHWADVRIGRGHFHSLMGSLEIFQKKKNFKKKTKKNKNFRFLIFWIQLWETLILSALNLIAHRNVCSYCSYWGMGHLFSLMSPIGILKKKSDFKLFRFWKKKRFLSFGFKLEKFCSFHFG